MAWKLVTAPTTEPIDSTEAKLHLKMDDIATDDTLIASLIKAARLYCELYSNMGYITQTWEYTMDAFCNRIELNKYPISAVAITYYDAANQIQTLATSVYDTDLSNSPAVIQLAYNQTFPDTYKRLNAVKITCTVGYGAASAVPDDIKAAIKLMLKHLYENREAVAVGKIATELPLGVKALLDNRRSFVW